MVKMVKDSFNSAMPLLGKPRKVVSLGQSQKRLGNVTGSGVRLSSEGLLGSSEVREGTGAAEVGRPERTEKLGVEMKALAASARAGLQERRTYLAHHGFPTGATGCNGCHVRPPSQLRVQAVGGEGEDWGRENERGRC